MACPKIVRLHYFQTILLSIVVVVCFSVEVLNLKIDTITSNSSLKDPNTIVSQGNVFKLGFFSPEENSTNNRYLGIFYVVSEETVVWVANRNEPLTDSSGTLTISSDGNLVLLNGRNDTVWSSNTTTSTLKSSTTAEILDSGNLVLRDFSSGQVLWESFMHPTHVTLPGMKNIADRGTTKKESSSSWPAVGNFSNGIEFRKIPEIFTWKNGRPYWRSGPWNGKAFLGEYSDLETPSKSLFHLQYDSSGTMYVVMPQLDNLLFQSTLDPLGRLIGMIWDDRNMSWIRARSFPDNECDIYGRCGAFGSCCW